MRSFASVCALFEPNSLLRPSIPRLNARFCFLENSIRARKITAANQTTLFCAQVRKICISFGIDVKISERLQFNFGQPNFRNFSAFLVKQTDKERLVVAYGPAYYFGNSEFAVQRQDCKIWIAIPKFLTQFRIWMQNSAIQARLCCAQRQQHVRPRGCVVQISCCPSSRLQSARGGREKGKIGGRKRKSSFQSTREIGCKGV